MINVDSAFDCALKKFLPHVVVVPMAEAYAFQDGLICLPSRLLLTNFSSKLTVCMWSINIKNASFSATSSAAIYDDCSLQYFIQ
jgi:hypothetical protein